MPPPKGFFDGFTRLDELLIENTKQIAKLVELMQKEEIIDYDWGSKLLPFLSKDIQLTTLGKSYYQLDFPQIKQTGSNVVTTIPILLPHILIGLYIKHVDADLADATTSLTFSGKFVLRENLNFALASFTSTAADEAFLFPLSEGVKNKTNYQFNTNTTNGHFVYITMIVEGT